VLLSINPEIINKGDLSSHIANYGFKNCDISIEQLAEYINKGFAFTCQLSGKRCSDNFLAAQFIAQDFDSWSLKEAINNPFIRTHGSLLYTTPSHQQNGNGDRFRIVYELEEPVIDADEYKMLVGALLEKVPQADKSCSDIARVYFGSKDSNPEVINGTF